MIYPDEEKVTYDYNLDGQVDHVRGYKSYGYDYVNSEFSVILVRHASRSMSVHT